MLPVDFRSAISPTQHFSVSSSEQKKMGKEVGQVCSDISKKMHTIGRELKELTGKDKRTVDESSRMAKRLKTAAKLETTVKELSAAVDRMVIESERLDSSKPIGQIVKFEQKLEKTTNELKKAVKTLVQQTDKGTKVKLEDVAEELEAISEKCRASKQELNEIKSSFDIQPGVHKKVSLFGLFISHLPGLRSGKLDKFYSEFWTLFDERNRIKEKGEKAHTITEVNYLLAHVARSMDHLDQRKAATSAMIDKYQDKPKELKEAQELLSVLVREFENFNSLKNELTNKKELLKIQSQVNELSASATKLHSYDLNLQIDLKIQLTSVSSKLDEFHNLNPENKKLQREISSQIDNKLIIIDNYIFDLTEKGLTKETFSNYIQRFENEVKGNLIRESGQKRSGHWNPEREQLFLDSARKEIELLASAAERFLPDDQAVKQKLDSLSQRVNQMEEALEMGLAVRSQQIKDAQKSIQKSHAEIEKLVANKKLTPQDKTINIQKHETDVRSALSLLKDLKVSAKVPLYPAWQAAAEEGSKVIAHSQREIASLEAKIQFPGFHTTLKRLHAEQMECIQSQELTSTQKLAKLNALAFEVAPVINDCKKMPITETMAEFKELQKILQEASSLEKSIQGDLREIKVDVSGLNFRARFAVKARRTINLVQRLGGAWNALTILAGASISWDPKRLRTGKHELLHQAGAEHVQLQSKTGCLVDAHYLSAATFMDKLEKLGGERKVVQLKGKDPLLKGTEYLVRIKGESPVSMREIKIKDRGILQNLSLQQNFTIIEDVNGKFFLIESVGQKRLSEAELLQDGKLKNVKNIKGVSIEKAPEIIPAPALTAEFGCVKFPKNSSQWKEASALLKKMGVGYSAWSLVQTSDAAYLVPKQDARKVQLAVIGQQIGSKTISLEEKSAKKTTDSPDRGTVLLTMPQLGIYEQYTEEMLTFALQGVNIMMYNNPGKGLSTGRADRENIDASIEAAYQYLKKDKNIPDEKILAKGQCFGGAPTAWLGQEHPQINLMLDQNPANFHEVVVNAIEEALIPDKKEESAQWLERIVKNNFIICGIAKIFLGGYDVPSNLAHNRGNKLLHINVVDQKGRGGDKLVPPDHPQKMRAAIPETESHKVTVSMNAGGEHITHWWKNSESKKTINEFLSQTGISQSLFF